MYPLQNPVSVFKIQRKFKFCGQLLELEHIPKQTRIDDADFCFAILDTETTGLDPKNDKLIEICVSLFQIKCEHMRKVGEFHGLQDPGIPLNENITRITGLKNKDLAGQCIDKARLKAILLEVNFVVAHNAGFDKSFIDAFLGEELPIRWACSSSDIPWDEFGLASKRLDYLCFAHGFFYNAHRAQIDVDALAFLISYSNDYKIDYPIYFKYLLEAAMDSRLLLKVWCRFKDKDILKLAGFHWHPESKSWQKAVSGTKYRELYKWVEEKLPRATCKFDFIADAKDHTVTIATTDPVKPEQYCLKKVPKTYSGIDHDELYEECRPATADWCIENDERY